VTFRVEVGDQEQSPSMEFTSEADFREWLAGAKMWERKEGKELVRGVRTLRQALSIQAQAVATGTHLFLAESLREQVRTLDDTLKSRAKGIELQTTKAVVRDPTLLKKVGPLRLLNDGGSVVFLRNGKRKLEADGLALNTSTLVLNEAKSTADADSVEQVRDGVALLRDMLSNPVGLSTKPPEVLEEIVGSGVRSVVGVLSAFTFPADVQRMCAANEVFAVQTTGEGYGASTQA
jgi:hypothetical protein